MNPRLAGSGKFVASQDVAAEVRDRHRADLRRLHGELFDGLGELSDSPTIEVAEQLPHLQGPALTDRFARITVMISRTLDMQGAEGAAPGTGFVWVSVRGSHRTLDRGVRLARQEEDGWARAAFGEQWESQAHRVGEVTRFASGRLPATHFVLHLDADRRPVPAPPKTTLHLEALVPPTSQQPAIE